MTKVACFVHLDKEKVKELLKEAKESKELLILAKPTHSPIITHPHAYKNWRGACA